MTPNSLGKTEYRTYLQTVTSCLYYKPITIVNDDSRVINKLETSLTDDARVVNYDRHMFIVQATEEAYKNFIKHALLRLWVHS
jgi:hypothetical protein